MIDHAKKTLSMVYRDEQGSLNAAPGQLLWPDAAGKCSRHGHGHGSVAAYTGPVEPSAPVHIALPSHARSPAYSTLRVDVLMTGR